MREDLIESQRLLCHWALAICFDPLFDSFELVQVPIAGRGWLFDHLLGDRAYELFNIRKLLLILVFFLLFATPEPTTEPALV